MSAPAIRQGWVCPKCGHVYAPSWYECTNCNTRRTVTLLPLPRFPRAYGQIGPRRQQATG